MILTRQTRPILAATIAGLTLASALLTFVPFASAAPGSQPPNAHNGGQGKVAENVTSGLLEGTYISLRAPASGALLEDYTADGVLFFSRVVVTKYTLSSKDFVGSQARIVGEGAEAQVHDTPSSTLRVVLADGASADFELGPGVSAAVGPNDTIDLSLAGSNRTATVWGDCVLSVAGDARSFAAAVGPACTVYFRSHESESSADSAVSQATESGRVSAEVYLGENAAEASDVSTFGNTTVIVAHAGDRIVVSVDSWAHGPSSIVIHFAAPGSGSTTQVLVDGKPAKSAESLDDALDASNDGQEVEYALSPNGSTSMLVVSMPSSGSHVIEFQSVGLGPTAPPPGVSPLLGVALAAALVALAAAVLFRRR